MNSPSAEEQSLTSWTGYVIDNGYPNEFMQCPESGRLLDVSVYRLRSLVSGSGQAPRQELVKEIILKVSSDSMINQTIQGSDDIKFDGFKLNQCLSLADCFIASDADDLKVPVVFARSLTAYKSALDFEVVKSSPSASPVLPSADSLRSELFQMALEAVGGRDLVAAEYLMLFLLSRRSWSLRAPDQHINGFSLKLSYLTGEQQVGSGNSPTPMSLPSSSGGDGEGVLPLPELLNQLTCGHSKYIALDLDTLNNQVFASKYHPEGSDADFNEYLPGQITPGLLHLPDGHLVILDQSAMQEGKLSEQGLNNYRCTVNAMENLSMACMSRSPGLGGGLFSFPLDLNFLVLSDHNGAINGAGSQQCKKTESTEMFAADITVPVESARPAYVSSAGGQHLADFILHIKTKLRDEYSIPNDVEQHIQQAFIADRQQLKQHLDQMKRSGTLQEHDITNGDWKIGALMKNEQDLMRRLTLAKWMTLSFGRMQLDLDCWNRVAELERELSKRCGKPVSANQLAESLASMKLSQPSASVTEAGK